MKVFMFIPRNMGVIPPKNDGNVGFYGGVYFVLGGERSHFTHVSHFLGGIKLDAKMLPVLFLKDFPKMKVSCNDHWIRDHAS